MGIRGITPTGVERRFGDDEIIVSKTDLTGHITYANDVFLRVSGYTEKELIGAPHSILRHPDMPRAVFAHMWDRIGGGHEIFAYVNNLAKNGDNYWVLAHVTPTFNESNRIIGYHSNRRVPDRRAIEAVKPVYAALLAEEARHARKPEAVEASGALLAELLSRQGVTYDEFVWSL